MFPAVANSIPQLTAILSRLQRLEAAQMQALTLMQSVLERLESKFGPGFVEEELKLWDATRISDLAKFANEVNELVKQGQQPKATRRYRELTGVTWDEAHAAIGAWMPGAFRNNLAGIQLAIWSKAVSMASGPSDSDPQADEDA